MKIELKKLKIANHLSEETLAYTAEVWIDGKLAFHAKNNGHGGCDHFYKAGEITEREVDDWIRTNLPQLDYGDPSLETVVGDLIARMEAVKKLNRMLKTKVVMIDSQDQVYTVKCEPTPQNCDRMLANNPGCTIVNNPSAELRERVIKALSS